MFAEMWIQVVKDKAPAMYRELVAAGTLEEEAERVEEEAEAQVVEAMMRASNENDHLPYMERVQAINAAKAQARERAIAQIEDL
jgi:hypothetical protein